MPFKTAFCASILLLTQLTCLAEGSKSPATTGASRAFQLKTLDGQSVDVKPADSGVTVCLFSRHRMSARAAVQRAAFEDGR